MRLTDPETRHLTVDLQAEQAAWRRMMEQTKEEELAFYDRGELLPAQAARQRYEFAALRWKQLNDMIDRRLTD